MYELHVPLDSAQFPERSVQENRKIITLLGSTTKALSAFQDASLILCCQGFIVLSIGCDTKSDSQLEQEHLLLTTKNLLNALHHDKIRLSHYVYVLNVDDYVGKSTGREIALARMYDIPIWWLYPHICSDTCYCRYDTMLTELDMQCRLQMQLTPYECYCIQQLYR